MFKYSHSGYAWQQRAEKQSNLCYFQVIFVLLILDAVPDLEGATVTSAPADHQPENQLEDDPYKYPKNEESYGYPCHSSI